MDCITCCSSAAVSCSSQVSAIPSVTCSVASRRSQNASSIARRCSYLTCSLSFRSVTLVQIFPTLSASTTPTPAVVSRNASPSRIHAFPSPASNPEDNNEGGGENLSAKERRKLRNERREAKVSQQGQPWKEQVQDRLLEPKKKIKTWQEDADINRCSAKGVQWWMVQTTRRYEFDVAEQISIVFPKNFPGKKFKVLVPTVPVKTKLKDGSVSLARKKLYEGIVLLQCCLNRDVYFVVKSIPRAYDFFGTQAGLSVQPVVMPAPVSNFNMDIMFERMRKQEEEYETFKEQCRIELEEEKREKQRKDEEQKRRDVEQKLLRAKGLVLAVGTTVRVLSGPFLDFTGVVTELLPNNKIKAIVTVFGNDTPIVLDKEDVMVEAATSRQTSRMMYNR